MQQHKVNRYFVRYSPDNQGVYIAIVTIHNPHKLKDNELLKQLVCALVTETRNTHRLSVGEHQIDILAVSLVDAITSIELI
jgi:hypothetical protein